MKSIDAKRFGSCSQCCVAQLKATAWQLQQSSYYYNSKQHASVSPRTKDKNVSCAKPGRTCISKRQSVVWLFEFQCDFRIWCCVVQARGYGWGGKVYDNDFCQVRPRTLRGFQNRVRGVSPSVFRVG